MKFDWKDAALAGLSVIAPPVGLPALAAKKGYEYYSEQKKKGEAAAHGAIGQARTDLKELAASQRTQREKDLQEALAYFAPVKAEMARLYGRPAPGSAPAGPTMPTGVAALRPAPMPRMGDPGRIDAMFAPPGRRLT